MIVNSTAHEQRYELRGGCKWAVYCIVFFDLPIHISCSYHYGSIPFYPIWESLS